MSNVTKFAPRVSTEGRDFICALCGSHIFALISIDHFPICAMCRWCCSVEGRWGRTNDGIAGQQRDPRQVLS